MAAHSSVLAWGLPWMEEPGGLQSTGGHDRSEETAAAGTSLCEPVVVCTGAKVQSGA